MLVQNWMNRNVITIEATQSMMDAMKIIKERNIRHLPVMRKGKLVGIVTDRDLKRASPSEATTLEVHELLYIISNIKVEEIMTKDPITVPFDFTVEEAAEILLNKKISGLPVVDAKGNVVGTITQTDIFRALITLTGMGKRGIQFAFLLRDQSGSIKEVADIIRKYGGRMTSILGCSENAPEGHRYVFIRAFEIDRSRLEDLKKELMGAVPRVLYMVDHKENRREIYKA